MYTSFVGLNIDLREEDRVLNALLGMGGVSEVYTMMHAFDIFLKAYADDPESLDETVSAVKRIDGVVRPTHFSTIQHRKGKYRGDDRPAGGAYTSFIAIRVDEDSFEKVIDSLTGLEYVSEIYEMKEGFDIMVKVHADTQKRLEKAINDILNIGGVQSTYNFLAIQQKKGVKK